MAILIDLSQIAIANACMVPKQKGMTLDVNLLKHMIINSIRGYHQRLKQEYGKTIICCDTSPYWRKDIFPHYKASRDLLKSGKDFIDWELVFKTIKELKAELKEFFPYKILSVQGCEADDIIAVLCKQLSPTEKVVIVGGDKDYKQLHKFKNVSQFSPKTKEFIRVDNPEKELKSMIITGDKSDGIPNIRSASNTFVTKGKRQTPIRQAEIDRWWKLAPQFFCESKAMLENHQRNKDLIDFECIPEKYSANILQAYEEFEITGSKIKIMEYFRVNKMRNLMEHIGDF